MIRLKIEWEKEEVFPITELVKKPDFPIKRDRNTISAWIRVGVSTASGSRLAFPAFLIGNTYHSSVSAARTFIATLANRSAENPNFTMKFRKTRQKTPKLPESEGRVRRVN